MNSQKYYRKIQLICPTCGCTQLESDPTNSSEKYTCASCGRTMSIDELELGNSENINAHFDELVQEAEKDLEKDINIMLKKSFSGLKNIKFR